MEALIIIILLCLWNLIMSTAYLMEKSKNRVLDYRYSNAMEEVQRIRENYNQLKNKCNQES